jgi:hypothetical protein
MTNIVFLNYFYYIMFNKVNTQPRLPSSDSIRFDKIEIPQNIYIVDHFFFLHTIYVKHKNLYSRDEKTS